MNFSCLFLALSLLELKEKIYTIWAIYIYRDNAGKLGWLEDTRLD